MVPANLGAGPSHGGRAVLFTAAPPSGGKGAAAPPIASRLDPAGTVASRTQRRSVSSRPALARIGDEPPTRSSHGKPPLQSGQCPGSAPARTNLQSYAFPTA